MTDYSRLIRRLEIDLYKAEHGMGMPYDREAVIALRQRIEQVRKDEQARKDAANDNAAITGYNITEVQS